MKIQKTGISLYVLAEQFIDEQMELGTIDLKEAVNLYNALVTSGDGTDLSAYLTYLAAIGIVSPTAKHLQSDVIGGYVEFLFAHFGHERQRKVLKALEHFWTWCQSSGHLSHGAQIPKDLLSLPGGETQFTMTCKVVRKEVQDVL